MRSAKFHDVARWLVAVLASLSGAVPPHTAAADTAMANPVDYFKRLLSDPPIVLEMIYQDKMPSNVNLPAPFETGLSGSTNQATYRLVWQPNALFFRSILPPGYTNQTYSTRVPPECFARWDNSFYFLDPGQFAFVYQMAPEEAKPGAFPAPYHAALVKQARACEPLNLGINHLAPGSVRWEGDQFSALGSADQKPMFVRGQITGWTNRIPCELQVQYSNDMGVANYRLTYRYEPYAPPYFPTSITSYFQRAGQEVEYRAYRILSVTVTNRPFTRDLIDPERFIESHGMRLRWMTNGTLYSKLPSGALIETPGAMPKTKLTLQDYYANRYYYLAVLLTTVGFIALAAKTFKKDQQNAMTEPRTL